MQDVMDREPKTSARTEHREGMVARTIEQQTAKLPSDVFLWAAIGSIAASAVFMMTGARENKLRSIFIGQWAPTFLILGLYNKLVKQRGSEGM
jgi:hypothetical protein